MTVNSKQPRLLAAFIGRGPERNAIIVTLEGEFFIASKPAGPALAGYAAVTRIDGSTVEIECVHRD